MQKKDLWHEGMPGWVAVARIKALEENDFDVHDFVQPAALRREYWVARSEAYGRWLSRIYKVF